MELVWTFVILTILTALSIIIKQKTELLNYLLFGGITLVVLIYTVFLVWSTISINMKSVSGGPVHYHADFQIWDCDSQIDLIDPKGWDNKVGTALFHEHNDFRIHVEGPVLNSKDITLGKFFEVVGGRLNNNEAVVPTNNGMVNLTSEAKSCNGEQASLQIFVYKTKDKFFTQEKLTDFDSYTLSPYSHVPPGDCIIIELSNPKDKTEKICNFHKIAKEKGEISER